MDSKFSPRPWTVHRCPDKRTGTVIRSSRLLQGAAHGVVVARIQGKGTIEDANLIAAAPDLLEALQRLSGLLKFNLRMEEGESLIEVDDPDAVNETFAEALGAIAKATAAGPSGMATAR